MQNAHHFPEDHERQPAQHSFLLRFWRATPRGPWHATLQRATDEPAMHFAGIDLMFAFLLMQLGEDAPALHPFETDEPDAFDDDAAELTD